MSASSSCVAFSTFKQNAKWQHASSSCKLLIGSAFHSFRNSKRQIIYQLMDDNGLISLTINKQKSQIFCCSLFHDCKLNIFHLLVLDSETFMPLVAVFSLLMSRFPAWGGDKEGGGEEEGSRRAAALRGGADGAGEERAGEPREEVPREGDADWGAQVRNRCTNTSY